MNPSGNLIKITLVFCWAANYSTNKVLWIWKGQLEVLYLLRIKDQMNNSQPFPSHGREKFTL